MTFARTFSSTTPLLCAAVLSTSSLLGGAISGCDGDGLGGADGGGLDGSASADAGPVGSDAGGGEDGGAGDDAGDARDGAIDTGDGGGDGSDAGAPSPDGGDAADGGACASTEAACGDGVDDDCDGDVDCFDSDCADRVCAEPTIVDVTDCSGFSTDCDEIGTLERSTTTYACVSNECIGSSETVEVDCTRPTDGAGCDDGAFCNGADTCSGGSCSAHGGDPCTGGLTCSEDGGGMCLGCTMDADCPADSATEWTLCDGFDGPCDETGSQQRTRTSYSCVDNACVPSESPQVQPCSRPTDGDGCDDGDFCNGADSCTGGGCTVHAGDPCGSAVCDADGARCVECLGDADCPADLLGDWSTCSYESGACDESGEETRTVTSYSCSGSNTCVSSESTRTRDCSRETDGVSCDDGAFCNGADTCASAACTVHAGDPCTGSVCSEDMGMCVCSGLCGDANQDGAVDVGDASAVVAIVGGAAATMCQSEAADIDRSGSIELTDAALIRELILGRVTGGCAETCSLSCGDVNGDDAINVGDSSRIIAFELGNVTLDVCEWVAGDVNRDEVVDARDAFIVNALLLGTATGGCTECTGVCGDADQDGDVDDDDEAFIMDVHDGTVTPTVCQFDGANVNADFGVDDRDAQQLALLRAGDLTAGCSRCAHYLCGDANQDGEVGSGDTQALVNFINGSEVPTVCEFNAGDTFGNASLSEADVNLVTQIFLGTVRNACRTCPTTCGDINLDGGINSGDLIRLNNMVNDPDEQPWDACEFWRADVDSDNQLTTGSGDTDSTKLQDHILGNDVVMCAPID